MKKVIMGKICLILCLTLCLGGAAMAPEQKVAMGRYVEVPLQLPFEGEPSFTYVGDTIYCVNASGRTMSKSKDLDNWDYVETGHDEQTSPAQGGVNGIAVTEDGTLYLSSGWAMMDDERRPFIERIKDGKAERVQLDQELYADTTRLALCALPSGELLGLGFTEAYRFSADGVTMQKYAVPAGESIAAYGNEVAICSTRNDLITVLDIESDQVLRTLPMPGGVDYGLSQINYDAQGALYYVGPDGLYQSNAGSPTMTQIADGKLMTVSRPNVEVRALLFDVQNNPVIAYSENGASSLIAYHYDEKMPTEPSTILSVFTLYDRPTLRECANKFQQKYPDVMVDLIVALPQGTAITRDDAIRTLNTKVLAGKGPDVIVLDGLPVQSYIDKGVLLDLSPVVQPMIDSGELLGNIVGAFKVGDAIPAVCTRFMMPSIWGDVEGLNTLGDMANWAHSNPDALPLYAVDVGTLIGTFYPSCAPAWFTEDKRMNEEKIEAFLTAMKAIRGQWTYEAMVQKTGWSMDEGKTWDWNPYQPSLGNVTTEENIGRTFLFEGIQKQLPHLLRGVDNAANPNGAIAPQEKGDFASLPGQTEGCFVPMLLLGTSKGTANIEMALKFIGYALSEESQNIDLQEGFQVNVKALDAAQARDHTIFGGSGISAKGASSHWETTWLDPGQQKQLRSMIDALKAPVIPDFTLFQMIVSESTPFFEGKIDAKLAAENVRAKANAYLSE